MTSFLGIDLAWSMDPDLDSLGYCIIGEDENIIKMGLMGTDEGIVELAEEYDVDFVELTFPSRFQTKMSHDQ